MPGQTREGADPQPGSLALREVAPAPQRSANTKRDGRVLACFSGDAAVTGTAEWDPDGRISFITSDGYLHVFEADGRFLYSYTVEGTPLGGPLFTPQGTLVATSTGRAYLIGPSGKLTRSFPWVTRLSQGPFLIDEQHLGFLGTDGFFYLQSLFGGARLRRQLQPKVTGAMETSGSLLAYRAREGLVFSSLSGKVRVTPDATNYFRLRASSAGFLFVGPESARWFSAQGEALFQLQSSSVVLGPNYLLWSESDSRLQVRFLDGANLDRDTLTRALPVESDLPAFTDQEERLWVLLDGRTDWLAFQPGKARVRGLRLNRERTRAVATLEDDTICALGLHR